MNIKHPKCLWFKRKDLLAHQYRARKLIYFEKHKIKLLLVKQNAYIQPLIKLKNINRADAFPILNGLYQGEFLLTVIFNFAFRNRHQEGPRKEREMELNARHQCMSACADDNLLGENINIIKNNIKALLEAIKEVGLDVRGGN